MDVEFLPHAGVTGGNHKRLRIHCKAHMADKSFVENGIDCCRIILSTFGQTAHRGADGLCILSHLIRLRPAQNRLKCQSGLQRIPAIFLEFVPGLEFFSQSGISVVFVLR